MSLATISTKFALVCAEKDQRIAALEAENAALRESRISAIGMLMEVQKAVGMLRLENYAHASVLAAIGAHKEEAELFAEMVKRGYSVKQRYVDGPFDVLELHRNTAVGWIHSMSGSGPTPQAAIRDVLKKEGK